MAVGDTHEFDPRLRQTFFPAYFRLSPLQKHVKKVVGGFGKKFVLVLVWESQETLCVTDCHDMTLYEALNPWYNQPIDALHRCI